MTFFPYRFDDPSRLLLRVLGVRPDRDGVRIDHECLVASFGPLSVEIDLVNIKSVEVSGPYAWAKVIGPRLSMADHGLTFGTNAERGVCLQFHEPVRSVVGPWKHPGLTLTVDEPHDFVTALGASR